MNTPATLAQTQPSVICPVCAKPARVIARPPQRHRRIADHAPKPTELCAGSGKPVINFCISDGSGGQP